MLQKKTRLAAAALAALMTITVFTGCSGTKKKNDTATKKPSVIFSAYREGRLPHTITGQASFCYFHFIVSTRMTVRSPLKVPATVGISHTPGSPRTPVRTSRKAMGNTRVPNRDTAKERTGFSNAVKKEEKHISAHPTR